MRELLHLRYPSLLRVLSLARGGQNDIRTERGRSAERYRRAALTAASSVVARGIGAAAGLVSVPLAIGYLGTERYGLWMAITSVLGILNFADLGMGNGLLNAVSAADGKSDRQMVVESVSSAFFILAAMAAFVVVAIFLLSPILPWKVIFNVSTPLAAAEAAPAVLVFAVCVALNLPLGTVDKVQMGFQEGFVNNVWQSVSALLGLGCVIAGIRLKCGLPLLVAALAGAPTIARAANWVFQFVVIRPWLRPSLRSFDRSRAASLTKTGLVFFAFSLLTILGYTSDSLIIAHYLGAPAVATYAVVQKLFSATGVSEYLITPLWPAFGEAIVRRDFDWIRRTIRRSLYFNFAVTAAIGIPLVIFGRPLISWWTVSKISAPVSLLLSFAVLRILFVYQGTLSVFLNHGNTLRKQLGFFALASVSSVVLKLLFIQHLREAGVVWATICGFALFYVWPAGHLAARCLASARSEDNPAGQPEKRILCG